MGVGSTLPRPSAGETTPPSPMRVEASRPLEQEGAPEPPRSRDAGDPITISDGSGGDRPSKDARPMDEELEASPVARRMPWPIEERRKKEEEEREREPQQQLQEEQQQPRPEGGEEEERRRRQQAERLEELLEQNQQQELLEL
ncbi:trichoplein keratin filament-binding protein-like [Sorghum bicolor]|uniref:trichoplein keratin filament-binding protein-like n=1 Tax=Sorghum bicolor TaxID=4558 RepID=UPI000B425EE5|nr:trichoplein keratin filament-binding protein-like [Sorghum bicolor]|eukprot:XP_021311869.1 trichoplein keratin filament-binding protein-like [Sorghum bicolor]